MPLLLFVFWLILNGKFTVEIALTGAAISAALTWFARRCLQISFRAERRLLRRLPGIFLYLAYLVGQVILSNLKVMQIILSPETPKPELLWFQPQLKYNLSKLTLANSITLTPGTVTASLGEDGICVYALSPEFAEGLENSGFMAKLRQLEGEDHG